jgi:enamine deaminase RidA (YjgF/YER057c/UK114 family)
MTLPVPAVALGAYVPAVRTGDLVFTSGQVPVRDGALIATGNVGAGVDADTAGECARQCALNALGAAATVCDLDSVVRVVKLVGYVASAPDFSGQPGVIDAASQGMAGAFSETGRHAREAVGVAALPLRAPVELSVVLELG